MMRAPAAPAEQDTAAFPGVTVPADCTCAGLGDKAMLAPDALETFPGHLPQVTQMDMYATQMRQISQSHLPAVMARRCKTWARVMLTAQSSH